MAMRRPSALLLVLLCGCVPYATTYVAVEPPGQALAAPKTSSKGCYSYGVPSGTSFYLENVRFNVALDRQYLDKSYVFLLAPRDVPISIHELVATIRPSDGSQPQRLTLVTKGTKVSESGLLQEPPRDPKRLYVTPPLSEAAYGFWFQSLPTIGTAGTLQLPDFTVSGKFIPGPTLQYQVKGYVGYSPLNC
ncbi:hypothetical protein J2X20_002491 [Pelomonas saccharophila]|uniref:Lipoprotein n=1 Tax=Roseateles saccharophilus TaxID=304 RepID=A0ABU1YLX3_ROSSA|nr:hypothetical protein [Roseateles saccharophilus]MDR7269862.1 hypothetical protein [Roseateles saccharophilus]